MTSAYPLADDVLLEKVRVLALELGEWPSERKVMRACSVGRPRAQKALDALRADRFDPASGRTLTVVPDAPETHPEPATETQPEVHPEPAVERVPDEPETQPEAAAAPAEERTPREAEGEDEPAVQGVSGRAEIDAEPLVSDAAGAPTPEVGRAVPRWPILIIALGAFVAIWGGWTGLGKLTGFGPVTLLPGIADEWVIDSAITLPLNVEAYAAFAMWVWLSSARATPRARSFAKWSALGSLVLGAAGQIAYHLMTAAGMTSAPWQITAGVACLPVAVLGCAAALVHLQHEGRRHEPVR